MNDASLPDSLEQFLQTPPSLPSDSSLQQAILHRTLATVKPRRRRWRWVQTGAIAACIAVTFVAGWLASRWWHEKPQPRNEIAKKESTEQPRPVPEKAPQPSVPMNAQELEWAAFDAVESAERAKLYYRAGDLFLEKQNDVAAALRCYQQALANAVPSEIELNPRDNWLVLALKHDHQKER